MLRQTLKEVLVASNVESRILPIGQKPRNIACAALWDLTKTRDRYILRGAIKYMKRANFATED